jgi:hypothetical protein
MAVLPTHGGGHIDNCATVVFGKADCDGTSGGFRLWAELHAPCGDLSATAVSVLIPQHGFQQLKAKSRACNFSARPGCQPLGQPPLPAVLANTEQ